MKKLLLIPAGILLFIPLVLIAEPCLWGYVEYPGGSPASYAEVEIKEDGSSEADTVDCDEDGYYVYPCFEGTYDMYAWKGSDWDKKDDVYYSGHAGGKQVDFTLKDGTPK